MKLSENWLREWSNPALSIEELAAQITMAGLEVDALEPVSKVFSGVVIAEVVSVEQHSDADKLRVCQVSFGGDAQVQVVCGAPNVRQGLKIPFAQVGAILPDDFKIKKAKLRGVESFGMLCGASELGMEDVIDGLMELPSDAPVGLCLREYLGLDDNIIDVDLTPNRGDCLSVHGVAREVSVLNDVPLVTPEFSAQPVTSDKIFPVDVQAKRDCPCYVGRVVEGVDLSKETPLWLVEKLRRSGIRSIDPIVDVTNFVMLELGQPMHAFDLDVLSEKIVIRKAADQERLTLLDGQELILSSDDLVIADHSRPLALAGIMGGEYSGVSGTTKNIFLESAFFDPVKLAGKARQYGLHTDSSHRFERGVDWRLQEKAIERATQLIIEITGGNAGPLVKVQDDSLSLRQVFLSKKKLTQTLGFSLPVDQVEKFLLGLEVQVEASEEGWSCVIPSFRFDIAIEADLIEEVARLYGYNNLPVQQLNLPANFIPSPEAHTPLMRLKYQMVALGYQEAITYSFTSEESQQWFTDNASVAVKNPISADMSVMRNALLPGLLLSLEYNLNRQMPRVRLFESGMTFNPGAGEVEQTLKFAGLICGNLQDEHWANAQASVDFFDIKGDVESLFAVAGINDLSFTACQPKGFHPGQAASINVDHKEVGVVGALHPQLLKKFGITQSVFVFELSLDILKKGNVTNFTPISRFPSVRRDLAFIVEETVNADDLVSLIKKEGGEFLTDCILFDLYTGTGVEEGMKSLALGLVFQHPDKSLNDTEVQSTVDVVVSTISQRYGAILRN